MRRLLPMLSLLLLTGYMLMGHAAADVNNFIINDFTSDQTLTKNDPQGELRIVEHINLTFSDQNHGILRAIPTSYKGHSLGLKINAVSSNSGAPSEYSTYGSNGNTVLKIGAPSRTVTGAQEYTIDYTVHNVLAFYKDHTELYWDVNGTGWGQPFEKVSVTLHLPAGVQPGPQQPVCYSGSFGSTEQGCVIQQSATTLSASTTLPLSGSQTLTYVASFAPGYFTPYTWVDTVKQYVGPVLKVAALPLVTLILAGGLWIKRGRDAKGRGTIIPQYDAPAGLKPIDVGTIIDFKVDNKDITATLIDLAVRGYIKIIETKQDRLIGKDKLTYVLELTKNDFTALSSVEIRLLENLFPTKQIGEAADISVLKSKLYATANDIREAVSQQLTTDGYFRDNPLSAGKTLVTIGGVGAVVIFIGANLLGPLFFIGVILSVIMLFGFGKAMAARTAKGVEAKEHIEGLKMYLNVAEADRLKMLQSPNAAYASNAGEPVKTVELFEKLLPYAMVLGVEKQWAGQFKDLYTQPPSWYSGNWTAFNVGYLAGSLGDGMNSAVNQAFASPSNSGSSGFGGGGFSGGGGGGGGGGGW